MARMNDHSVSATGVALRGMRQRVKSVVPVTFSKSGSVDRRLSENPTDTQLSTHAAELAEIAAA